MKVLNQTRVSARMAVISLAIFSLVASGGALADFCVCHPAESTSTASVSAPDDDCDCSLAAAAPEMSLPVPKVGSDFDSFQLPSTPYFLASGALGEGLPVGGFVALHLHHASDPSPPGLVGTLVRLNC